MVFVFKYCLAHPKSNKTFSYTFMKMFINPLVTIATFLGRSYLNLQGMWSMVKTEFYFFCLFFKLKITKIFENEYFHVFLTVHVYYTAYDDKTLKVHRK
jgi:hypothetical protein